MLKTLLAPVQSLLLKNGQCVGCGRKLGKEVSESEKGMEKMLFTCSCGRIFVKETEGYRRALFEEIK